MGAKKKDGALDGEAATEGCVLGVGMQQHQRGDELETDGGSTAARRRQRTELGKFEGRRTRPGAGMRLRIRVEMQVVRWARVRTHTHTHTHTHTTHTHTHTHTHIHTRMGC